MPGPGLGEQDAMMRKTDVVLSFISSKEDGPQTNTQTNKEGNPRLVECSKKNKQGCSKVQIGVGEQGRGGPGDQVWMTGIFLNRVVREYPSETSAQSDPKNGKELVCW